MVVDRASGLYVQEGHSLVATASAGNAFHLVCSYKSSLMILGKVTRSINLTKYFSFGKPRPIFVTSIRLSTGQVTTNPDTFTAEELADVGATGPYTQSIDSLTHELSWDSILEVERG